MTPTILRQLADLRAQHAKWTTAGETVAVVPTMGALHAGHLSLVQAARKECDRVIVTIFVNPKQFNNPEDLANYPRTEKEDAVKLAPYGVDVLYVPDADQIYPDGYATTVSVEGLTDVLCGAHRPGHFDGVATVVTKIFLQTGASQAYFGEKDFQQLQIVRRMAKDLDIAITVNGCPTIREETGLAMSSRNLRLSDGALKQAATLYAIMQDTATELANGMPFAPLAKSAGEKLTKAGFSEVEYFDLRSTAALIELDRPTEPARLFAAAWLDGVRLIDNIDIPAK